MCIQNGLLFVFVLSVVGLTAQYMPAPSSSMMLPKYPTYAKPAGRPIRPSYSMFPGYSRPRVYPMFPGYSWMYGKYPARPMYPTYQQSWGPSHVIWPGQARPITPQKPQFLPPVVGTPDGGCYLSEHRIFIPLHSSQSIPGQCKQATCEPGTSISELGCPLAHGPPECIKTETNYNLAYPDCCPQVHCPLS